MATQPLPGELILTLNHPSVKKFSMSYLKLPMNSLRPFPLVHQLPDLLNLTHLNYLKLTFLRLLGMSRQCSFDIRREMSLTDNLDIDNVNLHK